MTRRSIRSPQRTDDMVTAADQAISDFRNDPYPTYAKWRASDPMPLEGYPGNWLVSTYANATSILRDTRFGACQPALRGDGPAVQQLREIVWSWVLYEDPPVHTQHRKLVSHAGSAEFVSSLLPVLRSVVEEMLDECEARRSFDLMSDLAVPMSLRVLADYMALPRRDIQRFRHWLAQIAPLLDGSLRASHVESGAQAVGELVEYLRPVIQARAADPGGDLISRVAASRAPTMSDTELVANCVLLLIGGYETTATLIGNGVVALLQEPGQLRRLRDDPGLGPVAVEEFLRFESPVQIVSRKALKDMPWAGVTFSKGNVVNIVLGSANRDPAQFSDPDRLDVGRPKNPHLAFAGGIHSCAGAALARVEARIAIEGLLRRFPNLALGPGDPVRRPGAVLRAWTSIPVRG